MSVRIMTEEGIIKVAGNSLINDTSPIGTIIAYMGNEAPTNYLKCDGSVYFISKYRKLANHINEEFGSYNFFGGDGITTFAVPDLRGEFLRGTGTNSHQYGGKGLSVGVHQDPTAVPLVEPNVNNDLTFYTGGINAFINGDASYPGGTAGKYVNPSSTGTWGTGTYTISRTVRPTNTAVLYCIKYELSNEGGGGNANIWYGTHAEYEAQSSSIADGTQVCFTDDVGLEAGSEYYSETEQIIGTYKGKPLYRKLIDTTLADCVTNGTSAFRSIDITSLDMDDCIRNDVYVKASGYSGLAPYFSGNNPQYFVRAYIARVSGVADHINILNANTGYNGSNATVILEYTKISDSTVGVINGIRNGDNYSTTERVVGTWINGETLYSKSILITVPTVTDYTTVVTSTINHNIDNISNIVNIEGYVGVGIPINTYTVNPTGTVQVTCLRVVPNATSINIQCNQPAWSNLTGYVTLKYTKTTD